MILHEKLMIVCFINYGLKMIRYRNTRCSILRRKIEINKYFRNRFTYLSEIWYVMTGNKFAYFPIKTKFSALTVAYVRAPTLIFLKKNMGRPWFFPKKIFF